MAVSLSKGGNVSLSRQDPGLKRILVGLGWHTRATAGAQFDLDASAFLLTPNGKVRSDEDFIFRHGEVITFDSHAKQLVPSPSCPAFRPRRSPRTARPTSARG